MGTVGRLFGALISKAGIPVPTEITQKVLTAAQHLGNYVTISMTDFFSQNFEVKSLINLKSITFNLIEL